MGNVLSIIRDPLAISMRAAIDSWKQADKFWRDKLLQLAIELKQARDRHPSDNAFSQWLIDNECNDLSEQDRAAMIKIGKHPEISRHVLTETNRRSPRLIWREDVKPRIDNAVKPITEGKMVNIPGRPVKITEGEALSDIGRKVVGLLHEGMPVEDVVKKLAISRNTVYCLRDILLLSERNDLSEADAKTISEAVKLMDAENQLREPMKMIKPIADRLWGERGQRLKAAKNRFDLFANSIRMVHSTCERAAEIELPYVNAAQAKDFHEQLVHAKEAIDKLNKRIKEAVR